MCIAELYNDLTVYIRIQMGFLTYKKYLHSTLSTAVSSAFILRCPCIVLWKIKYYVCLRKSSYNRRGHFGVAGILVYKLLKTRAIISSSLVD